ncbi:thiol reductant ABC exporter subunit CydC [Pseudonocardia sp. KRD-184]|uniref:Thiol reductant ABC exporter subunit CydC n=1 Tax=Pseudonocardia oceani TaxID=2792013 RepID=A0ABS6UJ81_9PSEU|nr:thiol reductant ABC exporter subunit CydC [Pseudonocardia oceani]MBW0099276.1 thiol reductant ABC exporter subunit CydC [Pseudonocardia oceani]MBW0111748.1 thiol reductant ABC exporter subunit CydC [Pseudonocardia oceani]MBW0123945.1 thiol reductant ABC exporter subunit CydC [Pseudonocardia oceani]MBW0131894.1 thiol reductant ABC exporter subunit CydC [Pseudonocardia oceani]
MSDPLLRMIALARPRGARFALGVLAGAVATASAVALLAVAAWLIATAAAQPPLTALSVAVVATRALGVTRGVARYLERLVTHDAALRTLADVRVRVYERLAATEPVRRFRSGDLVTRLVGDTDATQDLLVRGLTPPAAALVTGAGVVALSTAVLVPGGVLLAAGLLLGGLAVPLLAAAAGRGPGRRAAAARAELSTALVDAVHGAPDLQAFGAMDAAVARVEAADAALTRVARRDATLLGLGAGASALVAGLTLWGTLLLGVAAVDELGTVGLAVLVLTALAAFEIVAPLPAVAARLGGLRAAGARLFDVLDTPPALTRRATAPVLAFPGLRIRELRVRYGPDEPWVLDGLDLDLPPGRRVAVVGPSGVGKSTLASVLFRFRDPDGGTVHLDGVDVTTQDADDVRTAIGGVPADPHVFDSTVRENLRLARPGATDAELVAVLDRVRLTGALAPAGGLDAETGPHGDRLSGGMRTRLALARALLADPRVLVLDEPAAHLDPETRDAVLADVLDATRGRTVVLITHDPAGLDELDEVVELGGSGGVIVADRTSLLQAPP